MPSKSIQIVSYSGISLLDLAGPLDVFLAANMFAPSTRPPYSISVIALEERTDVFSGLSLNTSLLDAETPKPHTLVIPGGLGIHELCKSPRFIELVAHMNKAQRLVGVCIGTFALATAGKLKGLKATTHWSAYDELEQRFPDVSVQRGPIYIKDGNIWTSAGITSGIDLALSLVEQDLGHSVALAVARHLVMFLKRPGDQEQFSSSLKLQAESSHFSDLHAWITRNLDMDLSISMLANFMNMTERTFIRKYTAETGRTPKKMVEQLRLDAARHLLVTSNRPLKEVACKTGFNNEATLIRRFTKAFGVTPKEHREHFRAS
ncbi:AraC family transcriptional regulator [Pseudomonas sp. PA1(2017)]|uniref:GlxA family transcriptional regulator n=1 Tax=Pseudomonas sp. PA1(2017) TaxID=1932113 RepID=UPI00096066D6|nr:helix-turn-helix domain-containing protein [Pseudomonas sp. PA1(2017)]OLU16844.1 AraC family transcriptional regulator [Pseudomonas sp. PA1(2017)]